MLIVIVIVNIGVEPSLSKIILLLRKLLFVIKKQLGHFGKDLNITGVLMS